MSGSLFLEKGGMEEEVDFSGRQAIGLPPVTATITRVCAKAQGRQIENDESDQYSKQQHNSAIHSLRFLYYLPDPAGSIHDTMDIVSSSIARATPKCVELGELAVGGRIGHGIPIARCFRTLRNESNNKSLTSKYKGHVLPPLFASRLSNSDPGLPPNIIGFSTFAVHFGRRI